MSIVNPPYSLIDSIARLKEQPGAAWGQAAANIGKTAGDTTASIAESKKQDQQNLQSERAGLIGSLYSKGTISPEQAPAQLPGMGGGPMPSAPQADFSMPTAGSGVQSPKPDDQKNMAGRAHDFLLKTDQSGTIEHVPASGATPDGAIRVSDLARMVDPRLANIKEFQHLVWTPYKPEEMQAKQTRNNIKTGQAKAAEEGKNTRAKAAEEGKNKRAEAELSQKKEALKAREDLAAQASALKERIANGVMAGKRDIEAEKEYAAFQKAHPALSAMGVGPEKPSSNATTAPVYSDPKKAEAIRAQFKAGKITREEATKQLDALATGQ